MKYMGWSWLEYCWTPTEVIEAAIELANEEAREIEAARETT